MMDKLKLNASTRAAIINALQDYIDKYDDVPEWEQPDDLGAAHEALRIIEEYSENA